MAIFSIVFAPIVCQTNSSTKVQELVVLVSIVRIRKSPLLRFSVANFFPPSAMEETSVQEIAMSEKQNT